MEEWERENKSGSAPEQGTHQAVQNSGSSNDLQPNGSLTPEQIHNKTNEFQKRFDNCKVDEDVDSDDQQTAQKTAEDKRKEEHRLHMQQQAAKHQRKSAVSNTFSQPNQQRNKEDAQVQNDEEMINKHDPADQDGDDRSTTDGESTTSGNSEEGQDSPPSDREDKTEEKIEREDEDNDEDEDDFEPCYKTYVNVRIAQEKSGQRGTHNKDLRPRFNVARNLASRRSFLRHCPSCSG